MNSNIPNREDIPPKQINRVAVPIRIDENGNRVIETSPQAPALTPPVEKKETKKTQDSSTIIFILVFSM